MNTILNNAKAIFYKSRMTLYPLTCQIQIQIKENFILFFKAPDLLFKIQFEQSYINADGLIDCRYFAQILKNSFRYLQCNYKIKNIVFLLPAEWGLKHNFIENHPKNHQQEREIIYYYQKFFFINLTDYEYFFDIKSLQALAIKKEILENLNSCFKLCNLHQIITYSIGKVEASTTPRHK